MVDKSQPPTTTTNTLQLQDIRNFRIKEATGDDHHWELILIPFASSNIKVVTSHGGKLVSPIRNISISIIHWKSPVIWKLFVSLDLGSRISQFIFGSHVLQPPEDCLA